MNKRFEGTLERIDKCRWRIPKSHKAGMLVDGIIYADDRLIESIRHDYSPEQVPNVACLPGTVRHAWGLPAIHPPRHTPTAKKNVPPRPTTRPTPFSHCDPGVAPATATLRRASAR